MVQDGPSSTDIRRWVEDFNDPRVLYRESVERRGFWGHPNRKWLLEEVTSKWVSWGNADNYYCPIYVEWMKSVGDEFELDVVLTNIVHNYKDVNPYPCPPYSVLDARPVLGGVDFISFIINTEVVKEVGLNHTEFSGQDGKIIDDTKQLFESQGREFRWNKIPSVLACHN
jgi:hypothetical protein